jgi:heme/copper-type cytochrome/quinol oxidase subunit 2
MKHTHRAATAPIVAGGCGALALVVIGAALPVESLAQGCSMCATYLSNGQDPRAEAFRISMLFLMSMPFVVVSVVGGWFAWMYRRHRVRRPALRVLRTEREGTT